MAHRQIIRFPLRIVEVGLTLGTLLADYILPVGIIASLPYVAVVWTATRSTRRGYPLLAALACTGLTILGAFCSPLGSLWWVEVTNRALVISALWVTVYRGRHRRRGDVALRQARTVLERRVAERTAALAEANTSLQGEMAAHQEAAAALRQQRDWLDGTLASLGEAVIATDAHLKVMFLNRAAEHLTGWRAADACGRPLAAVLRLCDAHTRKPLAIPLGQVIRDGVVTGLGEQTVLMRPDGHARAVAGCGTPIQGAQGQLQGVVLVVRDLTATKRLEAQLRQSQKLAAVGTLAGGVAHEFNNRLAAILGFTELTVEEVPEGSKSWENLQKVLKAGRRAKQVVQQLLAFSHQSPPGREPVQLDQIIRDALTLLRASLPSTTTIQYHGAPRRTPILADPTQLHQVVMHLAVNAGDAMRETGGRLEIGLDSVDVSTAATGPPCLSPGRYARLRVRDTGCGMSPEIQERIFEPFFTTKEVGEGVGLGLATVHGIVTSYSGAITVASQLGRGTTFTIYLPEMAAVPEPVVPSPAPLRQEHGRVLVVDDEAMLVHMSCTRLARLGYEGVGCTDSREALERKFPPEQGRKGGIFQELERVLR